MTLGGERLAADERAPLGETACNDSYMLVEVEKIAKFPWSPFLAQIKTSFGHTAVRWRGVPDTPSGQYHVEWTIDEEIVWGQNACLADEASSGLQQGGHCVIVRGRLKLTVDGAAVLELGGDQIMLEVVGAIPADTDGFWVNLHIQRENIALYPYELWWPARGSRHERAPATPDSAASSGAAYSAGIHLG